MSTQHHDLCVIRVPEAGSEGDSGLERAWRHQWTRRAIKTRPPKVTRSLTRRSAGVMSAVSSLTVSITAELFYSDL